MMIALVHRLGSLVARPLRARAWLGAARTEVGQLARPEVAIWALVQAVAVWAAIVTAMLLAGCASFDGSKTQAKAADPRALAVERTLGANASTDAVVAAWPTDDWWKRFNDPALDALVDEALTTDGGVPQLRLAEARLRNAQAVTRGAKSREYPTVDFSGLSQRERFSENYIYPPPLGGSTHTINQAALNFGYDLDFWGRNRAAIAAARSQEEAGKADAQAARLAITTSIARAWFQLQRLGALREVTLAAIRQRQDIQNLAQQRFDAGLDTNAELYQAQSLLPAARVELTQIDESIGLVRNQIAALVGKGPDRGRDIGVPQGVGSTVVALPASLPAELIGRRPDLVAARWRVEAARSQIDVARAQFYPNVNLIAAAGLFSLGASHFLDGGSRDLSGGVAITLPIFEGGALRANLSGRNAEYDAAVEQYNALLVDAVHDAADQIVSLQSVAGQLDDQSLARTRSEQAYDVAMTRYKAGLSTYLTVLNAETTVLQQRSADANLHARILDLDVALTRALGGGYHAIAADADAAPVARR